MKIRSGNGGRGCISFLHRPDRKKLPNGGDGGNGGDVVMVADSNIGSLYPLRSKRVYEARPGEPGSGNNRYGRKGEDCVIKVPCGTTVTDHSNGLLIRDLIVPGEEIIIAKGGRGGYGNHADRPETAGIPGKELELLLNFKIIADIFLVGLPNTGKTALLRRLTGAGVQETAYPFATKTPQLGTFRSDRERIRLCELPSIYRASEDGRGCGTHFLEHLDRAKLIFFVLDESGEFAQNLTEGFEILTEVLGRQNELYLEIPRLVVVNKADLIKKPVIPKRGILGKEKILRVSAESGFGLDELMSAAGKLLKGTE